MGTERKPPANYLELLDLYAAGERDFQRSTLAYADLEGRCLAGANLSFAEMDGANLVNADLSGANLHGARLRRANLSGANLSLSNLEEAMLFAADLSHANLEGATLHRAMLEESKVMRATLIQANLSAANLRGADLTGANLRRANLRGTILEATTLVSVQVADATLGYTTLVEVDVSPFCDASPGVNHAAPSSVDFVTIVRSVRSPKLSTFLQLAGMPEVFIEYMVDCARTLDPGGVFKLLQSTFISYGRPDEPFARKLYEALHRNGVRTFLFSEHAVPGQKIGRVARQGVNDFDRVVLICSRNSLDQKPVLAEIEHSLDREDREGSAALIIPVVLDDYLFFGWNPPHPDVALTLKERVAADFRGWDTDPAKFDQGLRRLITALKK